MLEVVYSIVSYFELLASIRKWNSLTQLERALAFVGWVSFVALVLFVLFLVFYSSFSEAFESAGDWLAKKAAE